MHPHDHAKSSVAAFGGSVDDYLPIHDFLDSSKATFCSWQHRAILHNAFGCYVVERVFGSAIKNSEGKDVPVRVIAELHIKEDLGFVPTVQEWLQDMPLSVETAWRQGNPNMTEEQKRKSAERRKLLERFQTDLQSGVPPSARQTALLADKSVSQDARVDCQAGAAGSDCSSRAEGVEVR